MDCIGSHEAPEVLWGAAEIGRTIGKAARATFYLLEAGHLPARKIGGRWCASRRKLLEALIGEDGAGVHSAGTTAKALVRSTEAPAR
jgi:hypothetical protein